MLLVCSAIKLGGSGPCPVEMLFFSPRGERGQIYRSNSRAPISASWTALSFHKTERATNLRKPLRNAYGLGDSPLPLFHLRYSLLRLNVGLVRYVFYDGPG